MFSFILVSPSNWTALQEFFNVLAPRRLERRIRGKQFIEFQLVLSPFQHHVLKHLFQCETAIVGVGIVLVLGRVVRVRTDAVHDIDEFDPLFFRCRAPALKSPFVEAANDFIQRVRFRVAVAVAAWVGVLEALCNICNRP